MAEAEAAAAEAAFAAEIARLELDEVGNRKTITMLHAIHKLDKLMAEANQAWTWVAEFEAEPQNTPAGVQEAVHNLAIHFSKKAKHHYTRMVARSNNKDYPSELQLELDEDDEGDDEDGDEDGDDEDGDEVDDEEEEMDEDGEEDDGEEMDGDEGFW